MATIGARFVLRSGDVVCVIARTPSGFSVDYDLWVIEGPKTGQVVSLRSVELMREVFA